MEPIRPGHDPLIAAFEALARRRPGRVLFASRSMRLSVEDVRAAAGRAATALPATGIPAGSLVGLHAPDGPAFVAGLLAVLGTRRVPVLVGHPLPRPELDRIARALGLAAILETAGAAGADAWTSWRTGGERRVDFPAVVKLTSGSSGASRGIIVSTPALLADEEALSSTMGIRRADRLLASVPLSHSYGFASLVLPAIVRGIPLVVPETRGPFGLFDDATACEATVFPTVPAVLGALVELADPPRVPESVRLVLSAGSPLDPEVARRFRARHGRAVHAFYGASECGGICFDREGGAAGRGAVGTAVDGVRVTLEPVADGAPPGSGRVVVRSAAVAEGYVPQADERRLGHGRFASDDLACSRDGELRILDRLGDAIDVKGRKVCPAEIEGVLGRHPRVREAHVIGVPVASGSHIVRAVVVCEPGVDGAELIDWCRSHLAEHKVPRSVVIVDRIPRTDRGKVDRETLLRTVG